MTRKAISTGAYGAIGKAIAQGLAEHGLAVTLVGRNEAKLQQAVAEIGKRHPGATLDFAVVDLSREAEIKAFSETWEGPLHVLVNNAATTPRARTETPEGIELQWATNVLGYYWMIRHFLPHLKGQPGARIVNVASYWAGGLNFNDPEFKSRRYNNDEAYRQSKQADRMLSAAFAKTLKAGGITVNACHPGDVNSKLSNELGFGGSESPRQGADTPVWLAVSAEVEGLTGHYYEHREKRSCPFMKDLSGIDRLTRLCEGYTMLG
ncbi:MAG: SDR family NAD(P)-dependent oxidoreductase [bacterium]